jgi:hypothetical protein
MKFRKLRIAWSVFWGVACMLLIVLWLRSYFWHDRATIPILNATVFEVASWDGELRMSAYTWNPPRAPDLVSTEIQRWWNRGEDGNVIRSSDELPNGRSSFAFRQTHLGCSAFAPHLFAAVLPFVFAAVPWCPWWSSRFSLRTLLIAMTLSALLFGLVVYASR